MNNDTQNPEFKFGPGDIRKLGVLFVFLVLVVLRGFGYFTGPFYWIIGALLFLYALDVFYTVIVSQRTHEDLKAFIFQTAVPLFALAITGVVAVTTNIESSAVISMFGLSLAYTTYVVGKPVKSDKAQEHATNGTQEEEN